MVNKHFSYSQRHLFHFLEKFRLDGAQGRHKKLWKCIKYLHGTFFYPPLFHPNANRPITNRSHVISGCYACGTLALVTFFFHMHPIIQPFDLETFIGILLSDRLCLIYRIHRILVYRLLIRTNQLHSVSLRVIYAWPFKKITVALIT